MPTSSTGPVQGSNENETDHSMFCGVKHKPYTEPFDPGDFLYLNIASNLYLKCRCFNFVPFFTACQSFGIMDWTCLLNCEARSYVYIANLFLATMSNALLCILSVSASQASRWSLTIVGDGYGGKQLCKTEAHHEKQKILRLVCQTCTWSSTSG